MRGQVEENLRQLGRDHLDLVNPRLSGMDSIADHFGACGEQGVAFVPFFAIAGAGREAGVSGAEPDEVLAVARAHEAGPAQVRLAWAPHRGPHVLVIPGTGDLGHLADNVAAGSLRLTSDDLARLEVVHQGYSG